MAGQQLYSNGWKNQKHPQRHRGHRGGHLVAPSFWADGFYQKYPYLITKWY